MRASIFRSNWYSLLREPLKKSASGKNHFLRIPKLLANRADAPFRVSIVARMRRMR